MLLLAIGTNNKFYIISWCLISLSSSLPLTRKEILAVYHLGCSRELIKQKKMSHRPLKVSPFRALENGFLLSFSIDLYSIQFQRHEPFKKRKKGACSFPFRADFIYFLAVSLMAGHHAIGKRNPLTWQPIYTQEHFGR